MKKTLSVILVFILAVSVTIPTGIYASAATLSTKSVSISYGKSKTVSLKGSRIKSAYSLNKKIATAVKKTRKR